MTEKTTLQQLRENHLGCSIEQYVEQRVDDGWSIPRIAAELRVTPECLRGWIKKAGGKTRIEFPKRETVTA